MTTPQEIIPLTDSRTYSKRGKRGGWRQVNARIGNGSARDESGRGCYNGDALELEAPRLRLRQVPCMHQPKTKRGAVPHEACQGSISANAEIAEV